MVKVMFAVLTFRGKLKGSYKGAASLYDTEGKARGQARDDGDSVVRAVIDLDQEPLFIRCRRVDPSGEA